MNFSNFLLCACKCTQRFLPVNAFVVVVGVEELHLLEGLGAGETAGDGRMH